MLLKDKLTELSMEMVNNDLAEMKKADQEKYDQTEKMIVLLTELATDFLVESPEFREKFAQIHAKFLEYPESKQVIEKSVSAYEHYEQ